MNSVIRSAFKLNNLRPLLNTFGKPAVVSNGFQQRQVARNLWHMCVSRNDDTSQGIGVKLSKSSEVCSCGCGGGKHAIHSKAEKELVEFLTEEILAERKAQKVKTIPSELDGFKAKLNGSEVTLTKDTPDEIIKIRFNVNHTVDTDSDAEVNPNMDKAEIGELKSKPAFKIDVVRDQTTLTLLCSFIGPDEQEEGYNDIFGIDEISIYDGAWHENVYAVSGEVVDSYLYDLILNYLEEKGISNEFVEKLSQYSTLYEHNAYIGLLEGLSKFAAGK